MGTTATGLRNAGFTREVFEDFAATRDEPQWLRDARRAAFDRFEATPLPGLRDEEWRRTDIRGLKLESFGPAGSAPAATADDDHAGSIERVAPPGDGPALIHLDGRLAAAPAASELRLPPGVLFLDLAAALREHPDLLRERLGSVVGSDADKFAALHGAFLSSGTLLHVPAGVVVETTLLHRIALSRNGSSDFNHTLVILEEGAEATLVQETVGSLRDAQSPQAIHAGAVELLVGPGAKLRFVNIQNWDPGVWHFSRERAVVQRGGSLEWTVGALGSRLAKVNQDVALAGEGAEARVNGVMFTSERQHLAYFTRQEHRAPRTSSDLLYKGGLMDRSRVVWKGMIRVDADAQKTDAYQKNDNLLLSDRARADSIPGLEIEANDVRCTHGATAGQVDPDMIFYARSRGVGRDDAVRLIVEGFFANVYDRITVRPARETLRRAVASKIGADAAPNDNDNEDGDGDL